MTTDAELTFVARLDDQASDAAARLSRVMAGLGGRVDPIEAAVLMTAEGVEKTVGDVEAASAAATQAAEAGGAEAGSGFTDKLLGGTNELVGKLGAVAATAGAAAAATIAASVVGAMNFEAANDKMAAQLGLTPAESERIGGVAGKLYAGAYGENLDEVNAAVAAVYSSIDGMSSASSSDLQGVTTDALNFASTFGVDVDRAVQVVGQTMRTGLAGDATEAFDLMTAASQKVPAALREDILDAADEYGPFFASLGMSGEDAFSALVAGSAQGMYGIDKTGDALKELTIRATDMSKTSVASYEAAGLNAEEMAGKFLAGGDVAGGALSDLVDGLLAIEDPTARANAAIGLFGTPLEDIGVDKIPSFLEGLKGGEGGLGDFAGAADRMGTTLNDNATSNLESFKRQAEQLAVNTIGGKLLPAVNDIASDLSTNFGPTVQAITGWMSEHQQVVGLVATVLGTAAAAIMVVVGAIRLWTAVQAVWNVVMSANPIGIIIIAIAALVAAIVYIATQTTWFQDLWAAVWGGIMTAVDAVVAWWNGTVVPAWQAGLDAVGGFLEALGAWFAGVWQGIKDAVSTAVSFVAAVITTYVNIWRTVIETAIGVIVGIFQWFASLGATMRGWFESARQAVADKLGEVVSFVTGIPGKIIAAIGNAGRMLYDVGADILRGLWNGLSSMAGWIKDKVIGLVSDVLPGPIKDILGIHSPSRLFAYFGRMTARGLGDGLEDEAGYVLRQASDLADAVAGPMADVAASASGFAPVGVSVQGAATTTTVIRHEHIVTSPDGSVSDLDARTIAAMLADDPKASATLERGVRSAARVRETRRIGTR